MSKKTRIKFIVGEQESGTPYLQMFFQDPVAGLPSEPPIFEVKPGSTMEEVEALASYLNNHLTSFRIA